MRIKPLTTLPSVVAVIAAMTAVTPEAADPPVSTPLKVQVTVAKYRGERRTASLLYTVLCNVGDPEQAGVTMGVDVPVVTPVKEVPQVQFKRVGGTVNVRGAAFRPVLRDGQSLEYTGATDQVTGDVVKVGVSLNVAR